MPPVVLSMRFFRYGCGEESHPLFRAAYSRSNRKHGTKIMRCFPHCCPDHVPRRYCGCSLHLMVTFDRPLTQEEEQQLVVCARFEAPTASATGRSNQTSEAANTAVLMQKGSTMNLPEHLIDGVGEETADEMWIRAVKESERRQQQAPVNTIVYSLNNRRFPKWIYNYERDSTKKHRNMQHCLRAYVFALQNVVNDTTDTADNTAKVVGHHASPGFVLFSYRRAGGQMNNVIITTDETKEDGPRPNDEMDVSHKPTHMDTEDGSGTPITSGRETNSPGHGDAIGLVTLSDQVARLAQHSVPAWKRSAVYARRFIRGRVKEKVQHIRIVCLFLDSIDVCHIHDHVEIVSNMIQEQWLFPAFGSGLTDQHGQNFSISKLVTCLSTRSPARIESQCPPVVPQCIRAAIHVLNSSYKLRVLQRALIAAKSSSSSDRPAQSKLLTVLADCIDEVYEALGRVLGRLEDSSSERSPGEKLVGVLVDDIVSLVYREPCLSSIRRTVTNVLRGVNTDVWDAALSRKFLAQMLEFSIVQQQRQQHRDSDLSDNQTEPDSAVSGSSSRGIDSGFWRGRWLLNTQKTSVVSETATRQGGISDAGAEVGADVGTDVGAVQPHSLSVFQFLSYLQQLLCIDIRLDGFELRVKSVHVPPTTVGQGTSLVLDGRSRVFRAFPDGLASLTTLASLDEWAWGDYSGVVSPDRLSLDLVLFCFQTQATVEESSKEKEKNTPRTVVFQSRVHMAPPTAERTAMRDWGVESRKLVARVEVSRCEMERSEGDEASQVWDLRGVSCSARASLFGDLEWQPLVSLKFIYDRVSESDFERKEEVSSNKDT